MAMSTTTSQCLYFAYGSNLALSQMELRCPSSPYVAPARLKSWRWQINKRGYANIVPVPITTSVAATEDPQLDASDTQRRSSRIENKEKEADQYEDAEVWGLLYAMSEDGVDEVALDGYEGVATGAYEKLELEVEMFDIQPTSDGKGAVVVEESARPVQALVYVNSRMTEDRKAIEEYVGRINKGIKDAVERGVPMGYVQKWIRPFISG